MPSRAVENLEAAAEVRGARGLHLPLAKSYLVRFVKMLLMMTTTTVTRHVVIISYFIQDLFLLLLQLNFLS